LEFGEGTAGWFFREDGFAGFEQLGENTEMGFRRRADEDAGDRGIGNDVLDIMGEATTGEEGGELFFPVGAFCTDIFQPDVEMSQNGIETGHAMDAESDEGVVFLCVEERGLKVFFLSVMIKSL